MVSWRHFVLPLHVFSVGQLVHPLRVSQTRLFPKHEPHFSYFVVLSRSDGHKNERLWWIKAILVFLLHVFFPFGQFLHALFLSARNTCFQNMILPFLILGGFTLWCTYNWKFLVFFLHLRSAWTAFRCNENIPETVVSNAWKIVLILCSPLMFCWSNFWHSLFALAPSLTYRFANILWIRSWRLLVCSFLRSYWTQAFDNFHIILWWSYKTPICQRGSQDFLFSYFGRWAFQGLVS